MFDDQALASLRIETNFAFKLSPSMDSDQALASLRIETVSRSRRHVLAKDQALASLRIET